ncbi:TPA: hypothetical protein R5A90_001591, partial [Campylobacter jejuni]|nr:hypothetical protein [Campylobacter jejuni]
MRIVDILNYFKDSGFNKIVNLTANDNIEAYCKISDDFVLPYSNNLQDVQDRTIALVNISNIVNFKEIFNFNLSIVCFCTKDEIISYTNLANLFSIYKLEIINIQDTNFNLIAILALKNINIRYNDEKLILNQRCEILSKELEDYKGSRLKYKRLYEKCLKE